VKEVSSTHAKTQPPISLREYSGQDMKGSSSQRSGCRRIHKRRLALVILVSGLILAAIVSASWLAISNLIKLLNSTPTASAQLATFPTQTDESSSLIGNTWGTFHPETVDTDPFVSMIQKDFGLESRPSLLYSNLLTSWSLLLLSREATQNFLHSTLSATPRLLPIISATEDTQLRDQLQAMLAQYPSSRFVSHLFLYDPQNNSYVNINGYSPAPAASVIKLPLLLEYLIKLDHQDLSRDKPIFYADLYRAAGAGELQYKPSGIEMPLNDVASQMIRISDNTCTNLVIGALHGSDAVNRQLEYLGLRQTRLRNWLPDLEGTNTISPYEMVTLLYNLDSQGLVSDAVRETGLDILISTHNRRLFVSPLPKEAIVAHKTGDIGTSLGDSGVIYLPDGRRFYMSMQVERPYNDYTARDMVQQASRISYDHIVNSVPQSPALQDDNETAGTLMPDTHSKKQN
jgi:beta-lactamase class A